MTNCKIVFQLYFNCISSGFVVGNTKGMVHCYDKSFKIQEKIKVSTDKVMTALEIQESGEL